MFNCTSLLGPLAQGIDLERQCQPGASGRYVYVFIEERLEYSQLDIWELQIYFGMYVHSVNTTCERHTRRATQRHSCAVHAWVVTELTLHACTNKSQWANKMTFGENPEYK